MSSSEVPNLKLANMTRMEMKRKIISDWLKMEDMEKVMDKMCDLNSTLFDQYIDKESLAVDKEVECSKLELKLEALEDLDEDLKYKLQIMKCQNNVALKCISTLVSGVMELSQRNDDNVDKTDLEIITDVKKYTLMTFSDFMEEYTIYNDVYHQIGNTNNGDIQDINDNAEEDLDM